MTVGQLTGPNSLLNANNTSVKKALGRDEFLQLLVAQLKNQNPMDPINGADFAAQLAQFSQLENLMQINQTMLQMVQLQQLAQAASLVGRRVQYQPLDSESIRTGVITHVHLTNNGLTLQVDEQTVTPAQIRAFLA